MGVLRQLQVEGEGVELLHLPMAGEGAGLPHHQAGAGVQGEEGQQQRQRQEEEEEGAWQTLKHWEAQ